MRPRSGTIAGPSRRWWKPVRNRDDFCLPSAGRGLLDRRFHAIRRARRLVQQQDRCVLGITRAIAMRWRWPPGFTPRSPTCAS
jgi:hypothetical protein